MSERSGRPTEPEPMAPAHTGDASAHVEGGAPTRPAPEKPIDMAQPIEVGDGPFRLTSPEEDEDDKASKPKSRTRTILLGGLLAVGLAGAAAFGVTGWRVLSQKDATVTPPAELSGLRADDTPDGRATADYLTTAISAEVNFDKTVGAVYRDAANPEKAVLFFGGTALIWSPGSDLESAFNLITDDQGSVTDVHDVSAGGLGGTMKCGATATADGDMSVCGWADHGSLTVGLFPGRSEDESASLLRSFRDAAQKRE